MSQLVVRSEEEMQCGVIVQIPQSGASRAVEAFPFCPFCANLQHIKPFVLYFSGTHLYNLCTLINECPPSPSCI